MATQFCGDVGFLNTLVDGQCQGIWNFDYRYFFCHIAAKSNVSGEETGVLGENHRLTLGHL